MYFKSNNNEMTCKSLLSSLGEPSEQLTEIWVKEAERRLMASRNGKLRGIPMEEVFRELKR